MLANPTPSQLPRYSRRKFLIACAWAAALSVTCGLVVTSVNGGASLVTNVVISMSIGMLIFFISYSIRLLIWGAGKVRAIPFLGILVLSIPIAQYFGSKLAGTMLGMELRQLNSTDDPRVLAWMGFGLISAIGGALFFAGRERISQAEAAIANERARAEATERQAITAQLQMLQAQIEPHMLFNTLANLQGLIALDPGRAAQLLDQLIQYLRATLSSSRGETTPLAQEFALMQAYLSLMEARMGKRLSFELALPDELRLCRVPPMLIQPLVENAIVHGLEPKVDGGNITVSAERDGNSLTITICDTGLGLATEPSTTGTHLGIANSRARLRGMFGARAHLQLEPNGLQGTRARVTLPMEAA